jgi:hypothetical protein
MRVISNILSLIPGGSGISQTTEETIKLLNEIFIAGDEQW